MRINVGDLVHIKRNQYLNSRHNNEMWLVMRFEHSSDRWVVKNIHNENIVWYKETMLMKIDKEASC